MQFKWLRVISNLGRASSELTGIAGLDFSFGEKAERAKLRNELNRSIRMGRLLRPPKIKTSLPFKKFAVSCSEGCLFLIFHEVKTIAKSVKLGLFMHVRADHPVQSWPSSITFSSSNWVSASEIGVVLTPGEGEDVSLMQNRIPPPKPSLKAA